MTNQAEPACKSRQVNMKKKTLTQAQIAARDARRERFRALVKQVAEMPEEQRIAIANKVGIVTVEGHPLSLKNMALVALQLPAASLVAGFRQWIAQGGAVKKGEHGAMIWIPIGRKVTDETTGGTHTEMDDNRAFTIATVFDISQTLPIGEHAATEAVAMPEIGARINALEMEAA
jgi:antirestriction factor ArdC-like protein